MVMWWNCVTNYYLIKIEEWGVCGDFCIDFLPLASNHNFLFFFLFWVKTQWKAIMHNIIFWFLLWFPNHQSFINEIAYLVVNWSFFLSFICYLVHRERAVLFSLFENKLIIHWKCVCGGETYYWTYFYPK